MAISTLPRARIAIALLLLAGASPARAQGAISRSDAIDAALARGPRLAVARADTAAAAAQLIAARALPNPALSASWSKDVPRYHLLLELPLDLPWIRGSRVGSARAARTAARYRFDYARAAVGVDADTTYTLALAARAHAELSRRNARDADSLLRMAIVRRDAGDASDLDVDLARVNAGQQENAAAADSLAYVSALLDLRTVMGLAGDGGALVLADSLGPPPPVPAALAADSGASPLPGTPLRIAAAEQDLAAAELALSAQRRGILAAPSISAGFDTYDPTPGGEQGLLPTFGIALPIPLLDRNRGARAEAAAERERARAELALARVEGSAELARARRTQAIAMARAERDRALVASAQRVAAMSLVAYREGEVPLASVLEAQRSARDVLGQYIDDLAAAWNAGAALRLVSLTTPPAPAR